MFFTNLLTIHSGIAFSMIITIHYALFTPVFSGWTVFNSACSTLHTSFFQLNKCIPMYLTWSFQCCHTTCTRLFIQQKWHRIVQNCDAANVSYIVLHCYWIYSTTAWKIMLRVCSLNQNKTKLISTQDLWFTDEWVSQKYSSVSLSLKCMNYRFDQFND